MYTLTASDFADTGQWRLILNIYSTGLEALLENTLHEELAPQPLCSVTWEMNPHEIRKNIEEAVYDHPRLLDDFSTRIVLHDPRTLFIPTEIAEESPDSESDSYCEVFGGEASDVMTGYDQDITAAWSMGPGVKSFLYRTFPGARITCNLLESVRILRKEGKGQRLYLDVREGETDLLLFRDESLISASTHEWKDSDDIAYLALNLLDVYGLPIEETSVHIKNLRPETEAWGMIEEKSASFSIINGEK